MGEDTADFAVDGVCDARFRGVREAFVGNFARHGEVGAAVAVTIESKPVVDLWAGMPTVHQTSVPGPGHCAGAAKTGRADRRGRR